MTPGRRQPRTIIYGGFAVAILLLGVAGLVSVRALRAYEERVEGTEQVAAVLAQSSELQYALQRAQGSARGYALSHERAMRTDALTWVRRVAHEWDSLKAVVGSDAPAGFSLIRVERLVQQRVANLQELIALADSAEGTNPRIAAVVIRGDSVRATIRQSLTVLTEDRRRALEDASSTQRRLRELALYTGVGGIILSLLVLAASSSVTLKELDERSRAEAALQHEAERQAVMIELQQAIATATTDQREVLELIVDQVLALTHAGGAAITFVDGDVHVAKVARGDLVPWLGIRNPLAHSLSGAVLASREPEILQDIQLDPRVDRRIADELGTRSTAILPIMSGDQGIGLLVVSSKQPNAFGQQELTALRIMSGILSAGITNAAAAEANRRLLAELRASRDAAETANQTKSDFLATMSHELRTPLNSVIGFANILLRNREGRLGEKDLQFLERIKENGTNLLYLINDVLDVSKIEAGRMEVRPEPTDVGALVQGTLAQLEPQVRDRPVKLGAVIPEKLEPVMIDPARFRQVLVNLIGNALKFTEQGSVTVVVEGSRKGRVTRIKVIDTGVGIPPDRLEAIFEAFTQAEATTERRFGGTGLGLTISRALLRMMNAELTVESTVGKGSNFIITFTPAEGEIAITPVPSEDLVAHAARLSPVPLGASAPLVLVVDDEPDARLLLRTFLEEAGYQVAEASDGEAGLATARTHPPALITLDLKMPGMAGLEMLRHLREDPALRDVPVVIVSVEASEHRGALIGAVDTLAKPVDREHLLALIQRHCPSGKRRVLIIDDDDHTRELYTTILAADGYLVTAVKDGLEALNVLRNDHPDLIILDLMMPVMDGGTFLAALRRDARFDEVPVAVITALDADSEVIRQLDGMAQAVIQKGDALEQSLRHLVERLVGAAPH
jgi:signal transduction histidine kinase/DNA-binding response OmpR family regulator/CHASE3 domain sensor protein